MKALVLISGGVDSALTAHMSPPGSEFLFFNYGQPAFAQERKAALRILEQIRPGARLNEKDLFVFSSPRNEATQEWAGRNTLFVSCAAVYAQHLECDQIGLGICENDWADYPDCRPPWVIAMRNVLRLAKLPELWTPLLHINKKTIHARAKDELGMAYSLTYGCYTANNCGTCASCVSNQC